MAVRIIWILMPFFPRRDELYFHATVLYHECTTTLTSGPVVDHTVSSVPIRTSKVKQHWNSKHSNWKDHASRLVCEETEDVMVWSYRKSVPPSYARLREQIIGLLKRGNHPLRGRSKLCLYVSGSPVIKMYVISLYLMHSNHNRRN